MRVAAIQMNSGADLEQNLELTAQLLSDAARGGCTLAVLPENFALMPERGRDKSRHAERPGAGPVQDFLAENAANGKELWKSNGTEAGTVLVKDINPGELHSYADNLTAV